VADSSNSTVLAFNSFVIFILGSFEFARKELESRIRRVPLVK